MTDRTQKLLRILQSYAVHQQDVQRCTEIYMMMERDGATAPAIQLALVEAIHDGLRYGNWPWTVAPKVDVEQVNPATEADVEFTGDRLT